MSVHFSSASVEWATPQETFNELDRKWGPLELDVCATPENAKCPRFYTKEQNGLLMPWSGKIWMNPPYGREIRHWVRRAYEVSMRGEAQVVCLLPARTDTAWWHDYCVKGLVSFIRGRLRFGGHKTPRLSPVRLSYFYHISTTRSEPHENRTLHRRRVRGDDRRDSRCTEAPCSFLVPIGRRSVFRGIPKIRGTPDG